MVGVKIWKWFKVTRVVVTLFLFTTRGSAQLVVTGYRRTAYFIVEAPRETFGLKHKHPMEVHHGRHMEIGPLEVANHV